MKSEYLVRKLSTFLVVISVLIAMGCSDSDPAPADITPADERDMAPGFTLNNEEGDPVSLSDFEGKPLVIFFFGNTCPLCISSAPSIESEINQAFSSSEMAIIGIDTWDGNQASVVNFKDRTGVTFDLLLRGSMVGSDYGTTYDRLVVVDGEGNIAFKGSTSASNDITKVVNLITELNQ